MNVEGQPWKLLRKDLKTLAQTWNVFSYSNLAPTSHTSDLNMDKATLVYGLVCNMDMNDMKTLAQTWNVLSYSNLANTSNTSDLNMDRARLVYGLVSNMDMNIGALISGQISSIA